MNLFNASFTTVVLRYYLMMAVVIASVLSGNFTIALLALPIFLSAILAPSFQMPSFKRFSKSSATNNGHSLNHALT